MLHGEINSLSCYLQKPAKWIKLLNKIFTLLRSMHHSHTLLHEGFCFKIKQFGLVLREKIIYSSCGQSMLPLYRHMGF